VNSSPSSRPPIPRDTPTSVESHGTVEKHIERIYARLAVANRAEAIVATVAALQRDH
jgi:hypothetical protein